MSGLWSVSDLSGTKVWVMLRAWDTRFDYFEALYGPGFRSVVLFFEFRSELMNFERGSWPKYPGPSNHVFPPQF